MNAIAEEVFRILLSLVAGGIIGLEREVRDKTAGFRTLIFISMGATLFTILSARLADGNDPSRISANIITGIGFLGAGAILREGARIIGLTTAATIWLTAALGMAIGGGQYLLAGVALIVSTVVLWIFPLIEAGIDALRELHTYEILSEPDLDLMQQIESEVKTCGLHLRSKRFWKENGKLRCSWNVRGSPRKHKKFREFLFNHPKVIEFRY